MEIKNSLCGNSVRKIGLLITKAADLGMDVGGYGFAGENQNSGNVYIWLEDYPFCLYIALCSDDEIMVNWTNPDDGEEHDISVGTKDLSDIYEWCNELSSECDE